VAFKNIKKEYQELKMDHSGKKLRPFRNERLHLEQKANT
jgi:hypothetical protein